MTPGFFRRVLFWTLFPVFIPQALYLRARAPRTPAPDGELSGVVGQGEMLRLLGLGDSIIAGVGTGSPGESLTAQIAHCLSADRRVRWQALGESGLNLGQILAQLVPALPDEPQQLIVVSCGVNDVTGLTSGRRFRQQLDQLASKLAAHSPQSTVVLLGLPPMGAFPLLPQPLRWLFGQRALALDELVADAARVHGLLHIPNRFKPGAGQFSDDGYHPNAQSVTLWARHILDRLPAS